MREILLSPPVAFVIYALLAGILMRFGRRIAATGKDARFKRTVYASGEPAPTAPAAPGYRPFFVVALFFAILHLGVLVAASGALSPLVGVYLAGLIIALIVLILG